MWKNFLGAGETVKLCFWGLKTNVCLRLDDTMMGKGGDNNVWFGGESKRGGLGKRLIFIIWLGKVIRFIREAWKGGKLALIVLGVEGNLL